MNSPSSIPRLKIKLLEKGRIKDLREIVVRVEGLPHCLNGQLVDLGQGVKGIIMGFSEQEVLVLALGDPSRLRMGREVSGVSEPFRIPVGESMVGRVVSALGEPCDQGPPLEASVFYPVFRESPPITSRAPVSEFLPTGTKVIDILAPLAKGQRQLILGDRLTGKTVIATDAVLRQRGRDVLCVYCCIGKSLSAVERLTAVLRDGDAMSYTAILVATDSSPVGEQFLVPFAAASVAEYFADRGRDVLVVFDDLTKHAWAYRQLSLLLNRPPGREAYPGDIFYVQTELMERAGNFSETHGGGSITYLGIAETLQGDLSGYIPSNLASMADGQICLSSTLFAEGYRPAVDYTLSLSIVGGRAQPLILRELSRGLRSDFARYREVVGLTKLQSGVSGEAERALRRGEIIADLLQQPPYQPATLPEEVLLLQALQSEWIFALDREQRERLRREIYRFALERNPSLLEQIEKNAPPASSVAQELDAILTAYVTEHLRERNPTSGGGRPR